MPFFLALIPIAIEVVEVVQAVVVVGGAVVGTRAAVGVANEVAERVRENNRPTTTHTYIEKKTIYDWWCNGLTSQERDYLLSVGYNDTSSSYNLHELKHTAKNREKELLTQQSQTYIQIWIDEVDYSSGEERRRNEQVINCSKKDSPAWKGMEHHKGNIKTNGKSGDGRRYYQWDNLHNDIEVYNKHGKHLGSMDPRNGNMYKGPVSGRNIAHLL